MLLSPLWNAARETDLFKPVYEKLTTQKYWKGLKEERRYWREDYKMMYQKCQVASRLWTTWKLRNENKWALKYNNYYGCCWQTHQPMKCDCAEFITSRICIENFDMTVLKVAYKQPI